MNVNRRRIVLVAAALIAMLPLALLISADLRDGAAVGINVVSREDGAGTRGAFVDLMGIEWRGDGGARRDLTTKEATIANKTGVMQMTVASDANAIGYASASALTDAVKALRIDGAAPTVDAIADGSYPVARPFLIATRGEPTGLAKDFIDFILSAEGQGIVAENDYIPVDDGAPPLSGDRPAGKIVVAGSSSVAPVMEKLQEGYLRINPAAVIEIQMSDSTSGMMSLIDGICDIGMASRDLRDAEKELLQAKAIAIDGIAVIVHPSNPLEGLSREQVREIFTGNITSWADIL